MKKLLLSLGAIASIAAPIAATVSCGAPKAPAPVTITPDKVGKIGTGLAKLLADKGFGTPNQTPAAANTGTGSSVGTGTVVDHSKDASTVTGTDASTGAATDASTATDNTQVQPVVLASNDKVGDVAPTVKDGEMLITAADVQVIITPKGEIKSANHVKDGKITSIVTGDELKAVTDYVIKQTHPDTGSIPTNHFDISEWNAEIVTKMKVSNPDVVPVLADPTDHDQISDYNDKIEDFRNAYNAEIADEMHNILNTITALTITEATYNEMAFPEQNLDDALIAKLGIEATAATKLKSLIKLGGIAKLAKVAANDVHGSVFSTTNPGDASVNLIGAMIGFDGNPSYNASQPSTTDPKATA